MLREGGKGGDPRARRPAVAREKSSRPAGDPDMEYGLRSDHASTTDLDEAPAGTADASICAPISAAADTGVTIVVCHSCRRPDDPMDIPRPGSRLHDALRIAAAGTGIAVRKIGCLGNCKRGISAAILRDGSWSYVFGELGEDGAADLIAGATLFAGSTDGFMPFRARPESLKRGLIARIPLIDHLPPDDNKDAE
jgi:predicted metal-binding protein